MKPKEFFRRWREGMKHLNPKQLLRSKQHGQIGFIIGIIFAASIMIFKNKMWYWSIAFFFMMMLQALDFISTRQQYKQILEMEKIKEEMKGE